jgi:predicted 3-demethylubiquinone-9 3-methyltransferase (glyoxalase superfamily)
MVIPLYMQKITPFLWFDANAEEAVDFYVSIFKDAKRGTVTRYGKEGFEVHHMPEGTAMTIAFELAGQQFTALNGGPVFTFTEAISFVVDCENQEEVDHYWSKLSAHPESEQCGWLKDKFGLSWQIVPRALNQLMSDPDPIKAGRVMQAMLKMKKIDIAELQVAYDQE